MAEPTDDRPPDNDWRVGTAKAPITSDPDVPHHLIVSEDHDGRRLVVPSFELLFLFETQRAFLEEECAERWDLEGRFPGRNGFRGGRPVEEQAF